jgi:hypothetical protein
MVRAAARHELKQAIHALATLSFILLSGCSEDHSNRPTSDERPVVRVARARTTAASSPPGSIWGAEVMIESPDAVENGGFAGSVDVSGDTAVVGSVNIGAAYVYVRSGTEWSLEQKLNLDEEPIVAGHGVSVAIDGDSILVGVPGGNTGPGLAYVFARASGTWTLMQTLHPSSPTPPQDYGNSVDLEGDVAVVGSYNLSTAPSTDQDSAAYVYERSAGAFSEVVRLDLQEFDARLGDTVAVSGDTVLVTAPWRTGTAHQGSVYFYARSSTGWILDETIEGSSFNDFLGAQAAFEGDTALLTRQGTIYEYTRTGDTWSEGRSFMGTNGLSLTGERVVVGSPSEPVGDNMAQGAVYVYDRNESTWTDPFRLLASNGAASDYFGFATALDGDVLVVGAALRDIGNLENRGAVYFYRHALPLGGQCDEPDDCLSSLCVDGRCCNEDCVGPCGACSVAEGAAEDGRCTLFPAGNPGSPACETEACTGLGPACGACADDDDCPPERYCADGRTCEPRKELGDPCDLAAGADCELPGCRACESGHCADGVCCDEACEGQCEACAESGSDGECVVIEGEPRGEREPCDPLGDAPCRARCDGVERAECLYVEADTRCGAACEGGAQTSAACDGQGRCVEGDALPCSPYVCGADACLDDCDDDDECDDGHRCADGDCVPAIARCSEDGTESISSAGESSPCTPFLCDESSGSCRTACDSSLECASGRVCDPDKRTCIEPPSAPADESGCGCRTLSRSRHRSVAWLALAALALLRRHRRPLV